jgi:uncharacterized ferritin-like protein (DUF455 family)
MNSIFDIAQACIASAEPDEKCRLTELAGRRWRAGELTLDAGAAPVPIAAPGRPARPRLVSPRELPRRRLGSPEGRAALLHSLAHIEFNAINLAWDAVYRFRGLPEGFYGDWIRVAVEEAYHFGLLRGRLVETGHDYGDFDAHDGLWEMARRTARDPLVRMALVPRVLEARGLDVTPGIIDRLKKAGDGASVDVLNIILRDEIGHVEIGTRWFRWLCDQRGLPPTETFDRLLAEHMKGRVKGPLYREARLAAGFTERELENLERLGGMS